MRRILIPLLLAALVVGCATPVGPAPTIEEKVGRIPALNVTATAPVGGTVYSQFRYWSKTGQRLKAPVNVSLMLGSVRAIEGDFVVKARADGKDAWCTERMAYVDPLTGPLKTACFLERGEPGTFTHVTAAPGAFWVEKALPQPVRHEPGELVVPRQDAFRYELLFQGVSNRTLRLAYREFAGDMARPAFFQDVSYEVAALPTTITFRSVRIEVAEAGNNGLTYRVLSGF